MSKDDKSESGFGFKDKAKAEETLQLLKEHDLQYQKLTVRGLLGRAKRVLSMTKSEEKIQNIKDAMAIFEKWLEENGGGSSNKNAKTSPDDKVDTVPGLGFKDKEAAEKTLKILEGRDPDYQKLAIKGLIGSSKRVLSGTKNEDKIKTIKEGVKILENFLEKFDRENRSKLNMAYLAHSLIVAFPKPKNKLCAEFVETYGRKAKGNYKQLRTLYPNDDDSISWDIIRNKTLSDLKKKMDSEDKGLFNEDGSPTDEHLNMIYWAYSPQPDKIKKYVEKLNEKSAKKRKSEAMDEDECDSSDSDDEDDDDEPPRKRKK